MSPADSRIADWGGRGKGGVEMDKCHVCDEPIRPGQDTRECMYCGRIGHEDCGGIPVDANPTEWSCNICWDEMVREYGEAESHVL